MWRRSVSRRSPPTSASTRAGSPATLADSTTAAMPRVVNSSDHPRRVSATWSVRSSPPASSSVAVWPKKQVSAAARTRGLRWGCSSASSRLSHSTAAGVANTLPPPAMTAGTPASWSASRASARSAWR